MVIIFLGPSHAGRASAHGTLAEDHLLGTPDLRRKSSTEGTPTKKVGFNNSILRSGDSTIRNGEK